MVNLLVQHNNLTQCINIVRSATYNIQQHSLQTDYSIFLKMATMLLKRTQINLYHLGNAHTSKNMLDYYQHLLLTDDNYYILHKDVKRYFMIKKRLAKYHKSSLWIVTNHFLNLMSKTDMMTVLDSAYIEMKSQLDTVDAYMHQQSLVTE